MPGGGFDDNSAAIEHSSKLLADYNSGLVTMERFSIEGRSATASLRAEMAAADTGTQAGAENYKELAVALALLEGPIAEVSGEGKFQINQAIFYSFFNRVKLGLWV